MKSSKKKDSVLILVHVSCNDTGGFKIAISPLLNLKMSRTGKADTEIGDHTRRCKLVSADLE